MKGVSSLFCIYQRTLRISSFQAEHEVRPNQKEDRGVDENTILYRFPLLI